jgi:hypothetical protein
MDVCGEVWIGQDRMLEWWMVDVEDAELMGGWDDDDGGKLLVCVCVCAQRRLLPKMGGDGLFSRLQAAELQAVASFLPGSRTRKDDRL